MHNSVLFMQQFCALENIIMVIAKLMVYHHFMKTRKIVQQLNCSFDEASQYLTKHNKILESFLNEIKSVENGLLIKLKKESKKSRKKTLKKKLCMVKSAYARLR